MALMLAKEQPKAIKTEEPGWLESTGDQGPALPPPAYLQNGTNPRRPDPWTGERSGTASRLTDVHSQPPHCARPTCLAPRPCTAAPATKSRSLCRVGRASLFGGGSFTGRGCTSIAADEGVPLDGDARILGPGWDVEGDRGSTKSGSMFRWCGCCVSQSCRYFAASGEIVAVDASSCCSSACPSAGPGRADRSLGGLCRAAPARCGSPEVTVS